MSNDTQAQPRNIRFRLLLGAGALAVLLAGFLAWHWIGGGDMAQGTVFAVQRGPLEITVLEGGSIEAKESQEIKSEVKGQSKIISIVEEGYLITPEDVENGLVLVELDDKELLEQQTEQELQYQNALASFTEAREQYEIQVNQNESDIKAAELEAKFARMDFEKYLGEELAKQLLDELELSLESVAISREESAMAAEGEEEASGTDAPVDAARAEPAGERASAPAAESGEEVEEGAGAVEMTSAFVPDKQIDFSVYADPAKLGDGEARQKLRELENDYALSVEEVGQAEKTLRGTQRLYEREFVTKDELENDEIAKKRKTVSMEKAETSRELFIKYEFPKEAEKRLSDYEEALRKLVRATKQAVSKLAQAEAKLNSAKARYALQERRRNEIAEQIDKCVIAATRPGLVVYGEGGNERYWRQERIEEGATVRERQVIITIPDTSVMTVDVNVHESFVKRVKEGQPVRIKVDAFPDQPLEGKVDKIGVLPNSQNRWMNPDLKVYSTQIVIDGKHDWLKPGMSAQAEIVVDVLENVLQVPLQAVTNVGGESICYVRAGGGPEKRTVETGDFGESFIEIKSGLDEGEVVLLQIPSLPEDEGAMEGPEEVMAAGGGDAA